MTSLQDRKLTLILLLFCGLSLSLCSQISFAVGLEEFNGQAEGVTPPPLPTSGPSSIPDPPEIGKAHQKALEVNSLIADFILNKIGELKMASLHGEEARQKNILGDFCEPEEPISNCVERYYILQKPFLTQIQNSMLGSHEEQARLACEKFDEKGNCLIAGNAPTIAIQRSDRPQLPYFPTYKDLQAWAKKKFEGDPNGVVKKMTQQDYDQIIKQYTANAESLAKHGYAQPQASDYVKYKDIYKDPNQLDPDQKFTVKEMNGMKPIPNEVQFKIANDAWKIDRTQADDYLKAQGKNPNLTQKEIQEKAKKFYNDKNPEEDANYGIFAESRGIFIDQASGLAARMQQQANAPSSNLSNPSNRAPNGASNQKKMNGKQFQQPKFYTGMERIKLPPNNGNSSNPGVGYNSVTLDPKALNADQINSDLIRSGEIQPTPKMPLQDVTSPDETVGNMNNFEQ